MWFSVDHCFLNIKGRSFFLSLQTTTSLCLSLTTIWHVLILFPVNEQFSYRQKMLTVFFYCASKGSACASTLRSRPPTPYSSSHIPTDRDNKAPCIMGNTLGVYVWEREEELHGQRGGCLYWDGLRDGREHEASLQLLKNTKDDQRSLRCSEWRCNLLTLATLRHTIKKIEAFFVDRKIVR